MATLARLTHFRAVSSVGGSLSPGYLNSQANLVNGPKLCSAPVKRRLQVRTLFREFHNIVRLTKGLIAPNQECLERFLDSLLAVKQAVFRVGRVQCQGCVRPP